MATLDDICEQFDALGKSGDTPIIIKFDGQQFELASITAEPNGVVIFELEEG